MRTSAMTATMVALVLSVTSASADDDFAALLADLSFADSATQNEPLSVAEAANAEQLQPVPTGICMPGMIESNPPQETNAAVAEVVEETVVAETVVAETQGPQVALQDPIPASQPTAEPQINLDDAFALQDTVVNATTVGHVHNSCHAGGCDANQEFLTCRPRNKVVLPASTLLQYFRSHPCYTNVWDGYDWRCGEHHKHLHGECDCFSKSNGHGGSDCASCDARGRR